MEESHLNLYCSMISKHLTDEEINEALDHLRAKMESIVPLSEPAWQFCKDHTVPCFFEKRSLMISEGQLPRITGFIVTGTVKSYYVAPNDGRQIITRLYVANNFCGPVNFNLGIPSIENIEFLTDTWMLCISLESTREMYATFPEHVQIYHIMMEYLTRSQEEKVRDLQMYTVSQRLQKFISSHGHFFNHFSVTDIASYLGTERETLTRMRSRLLKEAKEN